MRESGRVHERNGLLRLRALVPGLKPSTGFAKRAAVAGFAIGMAAALAACSSASAGAGADASARKPVLTFSGYDAANAVLEQESGIWKNAPYTLNQVVATFPQAVAGLNSGRLLVAGYGVTTALRQQSAAVPQWTGSTAPIKVIAGYRAAANSYNIAPMAAVIVRTNAGINSPADLRGKTWAFSTGGDVPTVMLAALKAAGLTMKDIKQLNADSYAPLVAAFESGKAQVIATGPSQVLPMLLDGQAKIMYTEDQLGIAVFEGFAATTKAIDNPKTRAEITDFLKRYAEFQVWYSAHPALVKAALIKYDQDTVQEADFTIDQARGTRPVTFNSTLFNAAAKSASLLYWGGLTPHPITDITATFDNQFNEITGSVNFPFHKYNVSALPTLLKEELQDGYH